MMGFFSRKFPFQKFPLKRPEVDDIYPIEMKNEVPHIRKNIFACMFSVHICFRMRYQEDSGNKKIRRNDLILNFITVHYPMEFLKFEKTNTKNSPFGLLLSRSRLLCYKEPSDINQDLSNTSKVRLIHAKLILL